jgi:ferric-dicitrate binding protein FerR (iron transport regulator)
MSSPDDASTHEEKKVRDAVRGLRQERADDAFRARLRHDFTSGRIARRPERFRPRPVLLRRPVLIPVVTALLAVALQQADRGPDWRVMAATGAGRVFVGERAFAPADTAAMARVIRRGGRIRTEGDLTLDLVAPGVAAITIGPDSRMELSAAPNRTWFRSMRARLASGDAWFTTGRVFAGATLDVATPEANVRATGTAFAVLRHGTSTCVCVMEGHVHAGAAGASRSAATDVPQGMRRTFGTDGKVEESPILEDSVHRLHLQRSISGALLDR